MNTRKQGTGSKKTRARRRKEALRKRDAFWKSLSGSQFERELAVLLGKLGFNAVVVGGSGDNGIDLELHGHGKRVIVQCKAHKTYISPGAVRELFGTLVHSKADEAWLVATHGFHKGAKSFVQGKRIRLLTIRQLLSEEATKYIR